MRKPIKRDTPETIRNDIEGKDILIAGACGGIGFACAELLGQMGAELHLIDVKPKKELEQLVTNVKTVKSVSQCDISNRGKVEGVIRGLPDLYGLIDASGICPYDDDWLSSDWNENAFLRVISVNLLGPINLVRAIMPGMMERGDGHIVLIGSVAGWMGGLRAGLHYATSKGGVHALVRWCSQRAVQHNVTVNGVAPGPVETSMTRKHGYNAKMYPLHRMGAPDEISPLVAFLCSGQASYCSGAIFDVNGGTYLR